MYPTKTYLVGYDLDVSPKSEDERAAFVREHTALSPIVFVPEIRLYVATDMTPLWSATTAFLDARAIDVPFWSTPWAGGLALARFVLDRPEVVRHKRVIDVGAGSGLVAIAAARAGASRVLAVDVDPLACTAARLNAEANGAAIEVACEDVVGRAPEELDADIVLAGDLWYERATAERLASWFIELSSARSTRHPDGLTVLTGDPGRIYVPSSFVEVARYEVPTSADLESCAVRTTRILRP